MEPNMPGWTAEREKRARAAHSRPVVGVGFLVETAAFTWIGGALSDLPTSAVVLVSVIFAAFFLPIIYYVEYRFNLWHTVPLQMWKERCEIFERKGNANRNKKVKAKFRTLTLLSLLENLAADLVGGTQPTTDKEYGTWKENQTKYEVVKEKLGQRLSHLAPSQRSNYKTVQYTTSDKFDRKFNNEHEKVWNRMRGELEMLRKLMKQVEDA